MVIKAIVLVVVGYVCSVATSLFKKGDTSFMKGLLLSVSALSLGIGFVLMLYIGLSALAAIAGIR